MAADAARRGEGTPERTSAAGADVLRRIADDRRRRIEAAKERLPAYRLRERLGAAPPAGRLEHALRRGGPAGPIRLIAEVKRASPSKGVLRADVEPAVLAERYAAAGAAAISLVTEPDHFQGDPAWVDAVRPRVALPILMKDFVVDSYQLLDAAVRGADAVLLLAALHSDVTLQRFVSEARLLGLDALVEVHDAVELQRALRAGATIIGVNNRDLRTFEVRVETTIELLPQIPGWVVTVAESGLSAPEDVARLRATRCDAALIGEAFMISADPAATVRRFVEAAAG